MGTFECGVEPKELSQSNALGSATEMDVGASAGRDWRHLPDLG